MDITRMTIQLERSGEAIENLVQTVPNDRAAWRPQAEAWSMADVVAHLAFEEVHDFRARLDLVLHRPQEPWHPADPARGVDPDRQGDVTTDLRRFQSAREASIAWLAGLEDPDWEAAHQAPFGSIQAGDILASWLGHDLLHLRQLTELRWAILSREVEPYDLRYAGEW